MNTPPIVGNIQDQTVFTGTPFATINLDNYVTDLKDPDAAIVWSYSGNTNLTVSITNRIANITAPPTWTGSETITFTATDTGGLTDSDAATFTVMNTPPIVGNIPDQTRVTGTPFATINLDNYVTDAEDPDSAIVWSYSGNTALDVSITNRVAIITAPSPTWTGAEVITFTATDTDGLTDSDAATFTVTVNHPPVAVNDFATFTYRWPGGGTPITGVFPHGYFLSNDYDVDGDTLRITGVIGSGITFDATSVYVTVPNQRMTYSFGVVISDGKLSASSTFYVSVT
jgi:hypothetical protein